jgi:hypothetical protein
VEITVDVNATTMTDVRPPMAGHRRVTANHTVMTVVAVVVDMTIACLCLQLRAKATTKANEAVVVGTDVVRHKMHQDNTHRPLL